jgi:uroporphyrinogen-III synthase
VIGPITHETAQARGFEVVVSAKEYTVDGLIRSILGYFDALASGRRPNIIS